MSKKKIDFSSRVVYSTNPDFMTEKTEQPTETPAPAQQTLYVSVERMKGGKSGTVVENFSGSENDLEALGKLLKSKCGVGGTVKDGIVLIQGEHRDKIIGLLNAMGYKTKKKGG